MNMITKLYNSLLQRRQYDAISKTFALVNFFIKFVIEFHYLLSLIADDNFTMLLKDFYISVIPFNHFQSHLDHFCWKKLRVNQGDLFLSFLNDMREVYTA